MVTLITEKLQNQSLDDLTCKTREAGQYSSKRLTGSGHLFPLEISVDRSPWKAFRGGWPSRRQAAASPCCPFPLAPCGAAQAQGLQWRPESPDPCTGLGVGSAVDLRGSTGPPTAPPTKRHCRSLSEPEELARCWSPWRPGGSKEHLMEAGTHPPSASSTPASTPEPGRRHGLLRCRSQPCVLGGRRSRCKRRREEDARWTRPSLDFLKMTRTLKNSKSLCSLDYEDDDEDDTQVKTVVSSPCHSQGLVGIVTPGCSPRAAGLCPASPWTSREPEAVEGEGEREGGSSGDPSDWDSAGEEGIFPLDQGDLDLEQIENN